MKNCSIPPKFLKCTCGEPWWSYLTTIVSQIFKELSAVAVFFVFFKCVYNVHQLDQKGHEQQLVEAYSRTVNNAALNELRHVFYSVLYL